MPVVQNYYQIDISLNGFEFGIDPKQFSLSINDSIYSLYNTASLTVQEPTGDSLERLLYVKGSPVTIDYGIKDRTVNKASYVVTRSTVPDSTGTPGIVSGDIEVALKGAWYAEQQLRSRAYEDSIGAIINSITGNTSAFNGTDVLSTDGVDTWYQPLVNDAAFVQHILLPNAFSYDSASTPFYAYTTHDGVFRFRHASAMYQSSLVDELNYPVYIRQQDSTPQTILSLKYIREREDVERPLRNRWVFRTDTDNGSVVQADDLITDHLQPGINKLPFIADLGLKTGYIDLGREELTVDERNAELGRIAHAQRAGMFIDRLVVLLPLNPKLHSGQRVKITTYTSKEKDRSTESPTFTDDYIIENSEHIWNGEQGRGFTKLIVGRKYIKSSKLYQIRQRLAPAQ
jgi:hypothetical protein